jgi:hypothetical protein
MTSKAPLPLVLLCVLLAQAVMACVAALVVAAGFIAIVLLVSSGDKTWYDTLLGIMDDPLQGLVQFAALVVATIGVLGTLGIFGSPPLIRMLLRLLAERTVARRWIFAANLTGWLAGLMISLLFWLVPGGQLLAIPMTVAGAAVITALILWPKSAVPDVPAQAAPAEIV